MPHSHGRLAHERLERLVVAHQVVQRDALHHQRADQIAAQRRRSVQCLGQRVRDPLVLLAHEPDLPDLVAVAGGERIGGHRLHCRREVHSAEPAHAIHHPLQVTLIRQQIEIDYWLVLPVARGELYLAGLGIRLVDRDDERTDLLAHRVPRGLVGHHGEHVARRNAVELRRIAQRQVDMPPCIVVDDPRERLDECGDSDRGMILQSLSHAGHCRAHLDPHVAEMRRGPDAGAQQMRRRMDRPDERITSRPRNSVSRPPTCAFTPTQRSPSNSSVETCVSVDIVRFSRIRVPDRDSRSPPTRAARRHWIW